MNQSQMITVIPSSRSVRVPRAILNSEIQLQSELLRPVFDIYFLCWIELLPLFVNNTGSSHSAIQSGPRNPTLTIPPTVQVSKKLQRNGVEGRQIREYKHPIDEVIYTMNETDMTSMENIDVMF